MFAIFSLISNIVLVFSKDYDNYFNCLGENNLFFSTIRFSVVNFKGNVSMLICVFYLLIKYARILNGQETYHLRGRWNK